MTESDDTLLKNLLAEIEQLKLADLRKYFKQLYGFEPGFPPTHNEECHCGGMTSNAA